MSDKLRKAVELVLTLHERQGALGRLTAERDPQFRDHGWLVSLDPMAEAQLRRALAEPTLSDADLRNVVADWYDLVSESESYEHPRSQALIRRVRLWMLSDHPSFDECPAQECVECGERDCPDGEPLHYHHDGCPSCDAPSTLIYVATLRALQDAANGLNVNEFCDALGWERNEYSEAKFLEFQKLGRLHVFDDNTLTRPIEYHRSKTAKNARIARDFGLEAQHG